MTRVHSTPNWKKGCILFRAKIQHEKKYRQTFILQFVHSLCFHAHVWPYMGVLMLTSQLSKSMNKIVSMALCTGAIASGHYYSSRLQQHVPTNIYITDYFMLIWHAVRVRIRTCCYFSFFFAIFALCMNVCNTVVLQ